MRNQIGVQTKGIMALKSKFLAAVCGLVITCSSKSTLMNNFTTQQLLLLSIFLGSSLSACAQRDDQDAFFEDFGTTTSGYFGYGSTGTPADFKWKTGLDSPTEPGTNILSFRIDPQDSAGAGRGPEIISNKFTHFGTYAARLKVPDVRESQPNVGAVVGYFTYHVDSAPGLSEIDFEWLLADPEIIYIGTWTGHRENLQRIGRIINLATGEILETIYKKGHNGIATPLANAQRQPETISAIKDYDASSRFYTYGFDWHPDRLRWWMIHPVSADTIVLWDYQGSPTGIPQNRSRYRMNFWHTDEWAVETNPAALEKPLHPYQLEVDWMSYEPLPR